MNPLSPSEFFLFSKIRLSPFCGLLLLRLDLWVVILLSVFSVDAEEVEEEFELVIVRFLSVDVSFFPEGVDFVEVSVAVVDFIREGATVISLSSSVEKDPSVGTKSTIELVQFGSE